MMVDISYLDEWLLENPEFSQKEREIVIDAIEQYIEVMKQNKKLWR